MKDSKIKVAWVCQVSNTEIRTNLVFSKNVVDMLLRRIMHKPRRLDDYGQWITNGIDEFKRIHDVELHIVSLHPHLGKELVEFEKDGIFYHFFKSQDDLTALGKYINKVNGKYINSRYDANRKVINRILYKIKPDIIHLYGAESPQFAAFALDVDINKTPFIVSLQTLMSEPDFKKNYPISEESYACRAGLERQILSHVRYIGSMVKNYKDYIWKEINPKAVFLNTSLFVGEEKHLEKCEKQYDFVYFSLNINKAADLAVEAFIIARQSHPECTLLIVGDYDEDFKQQIESRLKTADAADFVKITGKLPTHNDVINVVKKARYALLPLKIDYISGTIREAIICGLPVVTTITAGTPTLNEKRQSVLLSNIGDHAALAANMIRVMESEELCNTLTTNALLTFDERYNNRDKALHQTEIYKALIAKYDDGTNIPDEFCTYNQY